jgi:hypothetical protein
MARRKLLSASFKFPFSKKKFPCWYMLDAEFVSPPPIILFDNLGNKNIIPAAINPMLIVARRQCEVWSIGSLDTAIELFSFFCVRAPNPNFAFIPRISPIFLNFETKDFRISRKKIGNGE